MQSLLAQLACMAELGSMHLIAYTRSGSSKTMLAVQPSPAQATAGLIKLQVLQ